ncbi:hypothetical protein [Streptomyces goshikiensis]|uniref:hypothetical protein n=1 Tax=Streptomyces goshikiensis TaxID=1942 RepID=UPI0036BE6D3B
MTAPIDWDDDPEPHAEQQPTGPIDWARQQQAARQQNAEQPGRKLLDQLSDRELTALYVRAEAAEARCDSLDAAASEFAARAIHLLTAAEAERDAAEQRAEQAEHERDTACRAFNAKALALDDALAAIARVRQLATDWAVLRTHGGAAYELRAALNPQEPTP